MGRRTTQSATTSGTSTLRSVAGPYLTVLRRYGRFPFRIPLAAVLLFGPLLLAFEAALLLRVDAALGGGPPIPAVTAGVGVAVAAYALECAAVRRLAERVVERAG